MRNSGVLLHISSLPAPYGIGTFGRAAYDFVDFLADAGQTHWQILPLGVTSYGDSPYQSFSTFAGNPYFIDLDALCAEGLLEPGDYTARDWGANPACVDFALMYNVRYDVLQLAFARFDSDNADFRYFCEKEAYWLSDFARFMAVKRHFGGGSWHAWPEAFRLRDALTLTEFERDHSDETMFWRFLQYKFFGQWTALKRYANEHGIRIIGDLPIYVADDSADVWANPDLFDLDKQCRPVTVAGVPPDAFTAEGQLWGNPVYNWAAHEAQGYRWWIDRMRMASALCDVVRIDHFRGFESFYVLPADALNAINGVWRDGPGIKLFDALTAALGDLNIIAENLGFLTPAVRRLHRQTGYPGMNVLQFAFGADDGYNENLPHNIGRNTVVYAGTHDNKTTADWLTGISDRDRDYCLDYMNLADTDDFVWHFVKLMLGTPADLAVLTMQDLLALPAFARMNTPSTLNGNWQWRALPGDFAPELAARVLHITRLYGRGVPEPVDLMVEG